MKKKAKSNQIQRLLALVLAVCTVGVNTATLSVATEGGEALPVCGMTEHTHGPDCVTTESTLTCGLEVGSVHTHDASCQELQKTLTCQLTEEEAHQHSEECNTVTETLTCTLNETEAHSHSEQCYPVTLTCGLEAVEGHSHSETCLDANGAVVCGQEEREGHSHSDGCYTAAAEAACGKEEGDGHVHGETCYTRTTVQSCGKEETAGHRHEDACYESKLVMVCTKSTEPHVHGESCYTTTTRQTCTLSEHAHSAACYPPVCTCEAPDGVHQEGCALYVAPVCTCEAPDGVHQEGCALYVEPVCTCGTEVGWHDITCPLYASGGIWGGGFAGDAVIPAMSAKLYSHSSCAEDTLAADLMDEAAAVSGWTYDTDLYLQIELNNLVSETDATYQLVMEMQPVLYLNMTTAPVLENAEISYTRNDAIVVNGTGSYAVKTYSLKNLTYQFSKDLSLCTILLPFRYDNALWNKLRGSAIGDEKSPLLTVSLQKIDENDEYAQVEGCSAALSKATAGAEMPNGRSVTMLNAAGQERPMPLSLKSTETAKVRLAQMVNSGYSEGHVYQPGQMKLIYTPLTATIEEQTYTMLADLKFSVTGGKADYTMTTDENGTVTYTFGRTYFSGNYPVTIENIRFPEGLGNVTTPTVFRGRVTLMIDDYKLNDGVISVTLDNSEDPVFKYGISSGSANIYDLETVQFLGTYGIYNEGGNSNMVTVKLDFDPDNTGDFGVTTIRVMTPGVKGTEIPVRYTLINEQGDTVDGSFTVTDAGNATAGVLISRSNLPADYRNDYYYKSLEYDLEKVLKDTYLYHKSAPKSRSCGGTVWGYVFSDQVKTYKSFNAALLNTVDQTEITGMKATVNLKVDNNKTVSYGLRKMHLSEADEEITAGQTVTVGGEVFVIEYPYSSTNCLSDIRIGLLLPSGMTVVEQGITATFANGTKLDVEEIIPPQSEDDLWIVQFAEGEKIGYANERMGAIPNGSTLTFRIQLNTSTMMPQQTLDLQQRIFVAGYQRSNGADGSYAVNAVRDTYNLTGNGSKTDKVGCFSDKLADNNQKKLTIHPTPAVLDISTGLSKDGSGDGGETIVMESFADEVLYHINIQCKRGGSAGDFLYIIPIVNSQSSQDDEFVNRQQVDLKMLREATVTHNSGTWMDVLYTTETFDTYEEAKAYNGWWHASNKPAGISWGAVTMLKVVAAQPRTRGANVVIENGTDVTISVPLGFAGDPLTYPSYAGLKNSWQSRGYYDYTLGYRMAADNSSPEVSVVVNYQPKDPKIITLTAVKSSDKDNETLKSAFFTLPEEGGVMKAAQTYTIAEVAVQNVTLVSSNTQFGTMTSTEASKTFAIRMQAFEGETPPDNVTQDLLANGSTIQMGTLGADAVHTFAFRIVNGDALSDPNTPRSVTFTLIGDNGILLPVQINILQKLALADAKGSAIAAGKQYLQFDDTATEVTISQDAAFTAQFIAEGLLPDIYTGRTLSFSKTPAAGTTIVMIDWTNKTAPGYYHYQVSGTTGTEIPLTAFKGMGGGADYANPTGNTQVKEVLLFLVQLPQTGEGVSDGNTISLTRTTADNAQTDTLTYHTRAKRTFDLKTDKTAAAMEETVTLTSTSTASEGQENRYTGARVLVIQAAEGSLPAEARLVVNDTAYLQNSSGQFLVPVSAASPAETGIRLQVPSAQTVKLSAQLWVSATEKSDSPFMGQPVTESVEVTFQAAGKPSFKVTGMDKRLLHPADLSAAIQVTFDTRNLTSSDTLTVELQRKEQAGFVTETTGLNAVNGNTGHTVGVFTISVSQKTLSLQFLQNMPVGTYRLLFTVKASGTEMKIPYGFLLVN